MIEEGYTITDNGDIIEPATTTTAVTANAPETTTAKSETTTTDVSSEKPADESSQSDKTNTDNKADKEKKSALPLVGGGLGIAVVGSIR